MNIPFTNRGLASIAREEALVTVAFMDGGTPAIGYSHHGPEVKPGLVWTPEQSLAQMIADCHVCSVVLSRAIAVPLPPTCCDALVSLAYHVGEGTISRSDIVKSINAGDLQAAAALFYKSGYEDQGRLIREGGLFLTGIYGDSVNGCALGQMKLYTVDPHTYPGQFTVVPFPLPLDGA